MSKLTQAKLKSLFNYSKKTGLFTRKTILPGCVYKADSIAGSISYGYVVIRIKKKSYLAHRLAFLYELGYLPNEVDHINQSKTDNTWENLREVSHTENMKNKRKYKNNSSGVNGVSWYKPSNKWRAIITIEKKQISLGLFFEFSEAVNARKNAEVLYNFHENHGNSYE